MGKKKKKLCYSVVTTSPQSPKHPAQIPPFHALMLYSAWYLMQKFGIPPLETATSHATRLHAL